MRRAVVIGCLLVVVIATPGLGVLPVVSAAPVPSRTDEVAGETRAQDLSALGEFLARDEIARVLAARGLTPEAVAQRLARLSSEDVRALAANLEQLNAAGAEVPSYIWILLAILLVVLILVAIF